MLKPSDGIEGIKDFVLKVFVMQALMLVPPMVIGVGIGGSFDKVALLSKKAMLRKSLQLIIKIYVMLVLEDELLDLLTKLELDRRDYGGKTTALSLNIETYPTHIAGMPIAVSICCHVARHKEVRL